MGAGGHQAVEVVGAGFSIDPAQDLQAVAAGLGADRDQGHPLELREPAGAEVGFEQLGRVQHRFAATEGDGIEAPSLQGRQGGRWQAGGAAGFVGRHFHHPGAGFTKGLGQQGAAAALHPGQQQPEAPAGDREMLDQAVGDERGWHEIGGRPEGLQLGGGFTAHGGNFEAGRPAGQAAALALQARLHRLHAVGARHNQPVEVFEFG